MDNTKIIVREYLESLKEDGELDYLFPILLNLIGYQIITTPRASKGLAQHGKDVVAVGSNDDGRLYRFYFELKGYSDRDITKDSFNKPDGIRESLLEAKDKPYEDTAIPGFNQLPTIFVIVHNGILKHEVQEQYEGFLKREFPLGNVQRWDINKLADLFHEHLFSEYLLTSQVKVNALKRIIMLIGTPDYDFSDLELILENLISELPNTKRSRTLTKFFATLNLLTQLIWHYSKEGRNLHPAKQGLSILTLRIWRWILANKLEKKKPILREFRKLLKSQIDFLDDYFSNTLPIALLPDGLFSERGNLFEEIGYPIRSYEYLSYYVYYCQAKQYYPDFAGVPTSENAELIAQQKTTLLEIIRQNEGCTRPLLDNHLIAILHVVLLYFQQSTISQSELFDLRRFILQNLYNLHLTYTMRKRWPMMSNQLPLLIEYVATGKRPFSYQDSSSLLIPILFELMALLGMKDAYENWQPNFNNDNVPDLQIAHPIRENEDLEVNLFSAHLDNEYFVETGLTFPDDFDTYQKQLIESELEFTSFRTDQLGFPFLRTLAQLHFKNEPFPEEWRQYFRVDNMVSVLPDSK